jgi:hypothetical protein
MSTLTELRLTPLCALAGIERQMAVIMAKTKNHFLIKHLQIK